MPRYLPPEWAPQSAIQLTWPHAKNPMWRRVLSEAERSFVQMAKAIAKHQLLLVVCTDELHRRYVEAQLLHAGVVMGNVRWCITPTSDAWARDHGPITIMENGQPVILDFEFNAWGGKYDIPCDNAITAAIVQAPYVRAPSEKIAFILEGGSVETDGAGTFLSTTRCLLSPKRNAWNESQVLSHIQQVFGVQQVCLLQHGYMSGDDTDAHIDTLARFANAKTIVYQACDDATDAHYDDLKMMEHELKALRNTSGKAYELIRLPMPPVVYSRFDGARLPAGYANFLMTNQAILVPVFQTHTDDKAMDIFHHVFPHHEIVPIDARVLVENFGSVHCLTMQYPQGVIV